MNNVSKSNIPATAASVLTVIREELDAIGVEAANEFDPLSPWDEIDVDSVEVVELVAALEEEYGVDMANDDFSELNTARALAQRVAQLVSDLTAARQLK